MLNQKKLEAILEELARLQGHELNGQEKLIIRTRVGNVLAAKDRHRQRMSTPTYQWKKSRPPR